MYLCIYLHVYTHISVILKQPSSLGNRLFRETSNTLEHTSTIPTVAKRMKQYSTHEQNISPCATGMSSCERDFVTNERVWFAGDVLQMRLDKSPLTTYGIARCLGVWVRFIGQKEETTTKCVRARLFKSILLIVGVYIYIYTHIIYIYIHSKDRLGLCDCTTLQHTATRCNTLQRAATRCNTLQHELVIQGGIRHMITASLRLCWQQTPNNTPHAATQMSHARYGSYDSSFPQDFAGSRSQQHAATRCNTNPSSKT